MAEIINLKSLVFYSLLVATDTDISIYHYYRPCNNYRSNFVQQNNIKTDYIDDDSWVILSSVEVSIKKKMINQGVPLSEWNININRGILTGCNEAFIITTAKKDEIIAKDPKSAEIIRPILRGRDIKRYGYNYANLWIIATFPSKKYNIDDYPAVKQHLLEFGWERLVQDGKCRMVNGNPIKARKKTSNQWFETQDSISYWDDFLQPKIAYREISTDMDACLVEPGIYLNNKCYLITGEHLIYLLCLFNSSLFNRILLRNANITGGKGFAFIEKIKVPYPPAEIESKINKLYESRIESNAKNVDAQIDNIFYDIYCISEAEKKIIENL